MACTDVSTTMDSSIGVRAGVVFRVGYDDGFRLVDEQTEHPRCRRTYLSEPDPMCGRGRYSQIEVKF